MSGFLASGRVVDLALAVIAIELVALAVTQRNRVGGLDVLDIVGQLAAGAMLLLALRSALTGGDYRWTLVFMTASFPAHAFDLARRVRRGAR